MLVTGVLVMASAAAGEVRTGGLNAVRGGFDDYLRFRSCEAGLLFGEDRVDFLSGKDEGHEYGFATPLLVCGQAGEPVAAVDQLFDGKEQ